MKNYDDVNVARERPCDFCALRTLVLLIVSAHSATNNHGSLRVSSQIRILLDYCNFVKR